MNQETQELSKQRIKISGNKRKDLPRRQEHPAEKGYEQLSIKNICEEAGVSNGSFYHHFKTKDDLLSYYIEEATQHQSRSSGHAEESQGSEAGHHLCIPELCTLLPEAWG